MGIDIVLRIAGIGILVAIICQLLKQTGRDDIAMLAALAGLVITLSLVVGEISTLLDQVKRIFGCDHGRRDAEAGRSGGDSREHSAGAEKPAAGACAAGVYRYRHSSAGCGNSHSRGGKAAGGRIHAELLGGWSRNSGGGKDNRHSIYGAVFGGHMP